MSDHDWLVIVAVGVGVTALAAISAASALGKIALALQETVLGLEGTRRRMSHVAGSSAVISRQLAGIRRRYELLTDAQVAAEIEAENDEV